MINAKPQSYSIFAAANRNKCFQVSGYYVHYYNCFDMIFHSHDRIEMMYVVMGEVQIEFQSQSGEQEKYTILPNSYIFIDANVPHKITIDNIVTKICNLEFTLTDAADYNFTINALCNKDSCVREFFQLKKPVTRISDDGLFVQNILMIQKYIGNEINRQNDSYLNYLLSGMLLLMAKQCDKGKSHMPGMSYINKAVGYIHENYNRPITLDDIADVCGVSPNYLNLLFSNSFNVTVKTYVNKHRINRATLLLTSSDLSIDEIRKQTGYNNKAIFHQNFLKFVGIPPGKFRRNNRQNNIVKTQIGEENNTYWNLTQ